MPIHVFKGRLFKSTESDSRAGLVPVTIITLRSMETNKHLAEETLKKSSHVHLKHGTKYKYVTERIMLIAGTTLLFTAEPSYCYKLFRSSHWEELEAPIHAPKTSSLPQAESFSILCDLVRLHVICRRKIYSLTDLKTAYESMKTEYCLTLRVGDIKAKLIETFSDEISFSLLCNTNTKHRNNSFSPLGNICLRRCIASRWRDTKNSTFIFSSVQHSFLGSSTKKMVWSKFHLKGNH